MEEDEILGAFTFGRGASPWWQLCGMQRARSPEAVTVPLDEGLCSLLGHWMLPELGSARPSIPGGDLQPWAGQLDQQCRDP